MSQYSRTHLSDSTLGRRLSTNAAHDHAHTAELLADIAEFDARKLYLPAAQPSMLSYCVHELRYCEDAALSRIRAARAARDFPTIFEAVADGRLSLTAVVLLAPKLTAETAGDLVAAAAHKTKAEIRQLLAERFPQPDMPTRVEAIPPSSSTAGAGGLLVPQSDAALGLDRVGPAGLRDRITPLAPQRHGVQFTMDQEAFDLLREAQELLGHELPTGDVAAVFKNALRAYVHWLRKRKFAATDKPRAKRRPSNSPRHVPDHVKRSVWERDGGQCTFVSERGQRCPARTSLEFDHVVEVARGGHATVDGMRLRCRPHNQYTAECTFGAEFMMQKRRHARMKAHTKAPTAAPTAAAMAAEVQHTGSQALAAEGQAPAAAAHADSAGAEAMLLAENADVAPCLRRLGFCADETRRAVTYCATMTEGSLEDRVRAALAFLRPGSSPRGGARPPVPRPWDHGMRQH